MSIEISSKPRSKYGNKGLAAFNRKKRLDSYEVDFVDELLVSAWNEKFKFEKHIWNCKPSGYPRDEKGQFTQRSTGMNSWEEYHQTY